MPTATNRWRVAVSVQKGRVCCITTGVFPGTPEGLWRLMACKESRPLFRVESRQQLTRDGGISTEEVVFLAAVRILFWKKWARTSVHQAVNFTNPQEGTVDFTLLQSSMMSSLSGSWALRQVSAGTSSSPAYTQVTYSFQMWPKGVPVALRFMPGLVDAVKGAVAREVVQLFDKLAFVAGKVTPDGSNLLAAASEASGEIERAGGSFKCLQAALSGSAEAMAAAAAAEAAARRALALELQQQQQGVECHALHFSEDDDDGGECIEADVGLGGYESRVRLDGNTCSTGSSSSSSGSDTDASTEDDARSTSSSTSSSSSGDGGGHLTTTDSAVSLFGSSSSSNGGARLVEDEEEDEGGNAVAAAAALTARLRLSDSHAGSASSASSSQPGSPEATASITFASAASKDPDGGKARAAPGAAGAAVVASAQAEAVC